MKLKSNGTLAIVPLTIVDHLRNRATLPRSIIYVQRMSEHPSRERSWLVVELLASVTFRLPFVPFVSGDYSMCNAQGWYCVILLFSQCCVVSILSDDSIWRFSMCNISFLMVV